MISTDKKADDFIAQHDLCLAYKETKKMLEEHFNSLAKVDVEISIDPDDPECKQILFRLFYTESPEIVFKEWKSFLHEFTEKIFNEKRRLLSIELISK